MSEEIELAAKSVGESVGALAEASGVLGPVQELAAWVTSFIHYRRQPALAKQVVQAAEKIRASGLPSEAISDKLLRDLLEGASMEDEESMQERWANLLANAMTENSARVRTAFTSILAELEQEDARLLDYFADQTSADSVWVDRFTKVPGTRDGVSLNNLTRLELLAPVHSLAMKEGSVLAETGDIVGYTFTEIGWAFVQACREPRAIDQESPSE
jgi:Abortive infection alpha